MRASAILLFLASAFLTAVAQTPHPLRPVSTFSIVARDPQTGEMGVAVQSHWFAVGQIVPWAEAGVGAVATQSFVDPSYGKLGLDLMRAGKSAPATLSQLLHQDKSSEVRQVAMLDNEGRVAAWSGDRDIEAAGHCVGRHLTASNAPPLLVDTCGLKSVVGPRVNLGRDEGEGFSVQANLMSNNKIWPVMAKAFEETKGDLAERMLAALDAAQAVGGDIRGRQSAALIVVKAKSSGKPWEDRVFDLRVDDNPEPLKELRRLVTLQRAYNHMNAGDLAVEHKDNEGALREYSAAEQLASGAEGIPSSRLAEMIYWHAVALVKIRRVEESLPLFHKAFALQPSLRELTPRLPKSGLLPDDPEIIERITKQ
ncbi:MAG TPA: DUF1028 domain-containing protein [Terriglobales bacterium]|nr:DUF1028 domain-containing protein [Terriglobales bacterium]